MILVVLIIVFAVFIAFSAPQTVHLYCGKRPAGEALRRFQNGTTKLSNANGRKVHIQDILPGRGLVIHSPMTMTLASTRV